MDGFFAFQVAGASAVSIRSPGKDAMAVALGGVILGGTGRGPWCVTPKWAFSWILVSEAERVCWDIGLEV